MASTALGRKPGEILDLGSQTPGFCPVPPALRLCCSPFFCILNCGGGKAGSAVLVPGRKLGEILGQQSVDTADGAGAGMLLQPRPDALWAQGEAKLGERDPAGGENCWGNSSASSAPLKFGGGELLSCSNQIYSARANRHQNKNGEGEK